MKGIDKNMIRRDMSEKCEPVTCVYQYKNKSQ